MKQFHPVRGDPRVDTVQQKGSKQLRQIPDPQSETESETQHEIIQKDSSQRLERAESHPQVI